MMNKQVSLTDDISVLDQLISYASEVCLVLASWKRNTMTYTALIQFWWLFTVVTNDLLVATDISTSGHRGDVAMARKWHHLYRQRNNRSRGTCRVICRCSVLRLLQSLYIKWWYCSWPVAPAQCCFFVCILYFFCYCMIVLFVDNLFFYSGGQLVSCKASLAALDCMVFTARCTLVQSAVLRSHVVCLSVCPSVCPSVCLSVTLVNCDHIG